MTARATATTGLEGVEAGSSAICSLEGGLRYRGYAIEELAERSSFEETAWLVLYGDLPGAADLGRFAAALRAAPPLPPAARDALAELPDAAHPMEAVRTAVSFLGAADPAPHRPGVPDPDAPLRLLAAYPALAADLAGTEPPPPHPGRPYAGLLLRALTGREPTALETRAFDVSLILYAEHELNASTFAARVTASTLSDFHSTICAAIGALRGPLHGGANEEVAGMLEEIGGPARAAGWIRDALAAKRKVMGFGHRVYKDGDPRAPVLRAWGLALARERGGRERWALADAVQEEMKRAKGLHPNLDFPCAVVYRQLGIPVRLFTPVFAFARTAGWSAHVFEQWADNRLIRPRARYTGPPARAYVPPDARATGA